MASTETYYTLPRYLQRRIDRAFNSKDLSTADSGGGFIGNNSDGIPLSSIPKALQSLDLPPDDDEVLTVFRNAASGWQDGSSNTGFINLEDWRAVCGILLEPRAKEYRDSSDVDDAGDQDDSDEYKELKESSEGSADEEEYLDEAPLPASRRRTRRTRPSDSDSEPPSPKKLTARQKDTCLQTFALFFPDVSPEELPKQTIKIQDIQRVAGLLGEKLKAEEIIEMLQVFSTSPDKTMNLDDFERMMMAAELA